MLKVLQAHVENKGRIVVSAITYAEMRFGALLGKPLALAERSLLNATWYKKVSPKHNAIVDEFMSRVDSVFAWDQSTVEATASIKKDLSDKGTSICANDTTIAGHVMASGCVLVTNNIREFERVQSLHIEDWTNK